VPVLLLTGTPGTGKTEVARAVSARLPGFDVVELNRLVGDDYLYVEDGSKVVDLEALGEKVRSLVQGSAIIEGHLSHLLDVGSLVVVLRTHPRELKERLERKGFTGGKLWENLEAEAIDVCLIESLERHKRVYEVDTTSRSAAEVAEHVLEILEGRGNDFKPGRVDWLEDYLDLKIEEKATMF